MSNNTEQYIQNLFDFLTNKNRFKEAVGRFTNSEDFINYIRVQLLYGDLERMKPETLGKIMGAFEVGSVLTTKKEIMKHVTYAGNCGDMLREIVASCLAHAIGNKLMFDDPAEG